MKKNLINLILICQSIFFVGIFIFFEDPIFQFLEQFLPTNLVDNWIFRLTLWLLVPSISYLFFTSVMIFFGKYNRCLRAEQKGDFKTLIKIVTPEAENGDPDFQNILGYAYANGKGVPQDDAEAAKWSRLAAEQKNDGAQYNLGVLYNEGRGVPQDYAEAAKWYRLAADQGHAVAQNNLGLMYHKGRGVPQDDVEAAKWYRLAVDQADADAQYNLGLMYDNGEGVPQDDAEAYKYWNLAAAQGNADAKSNKEILEKKMTKQQIAEGQRLSREWFNEHQ